MSMSGSESDDEVENGVQPYDDAVDEESDDEGRIDESDSASGSEAEGQDEEDEPNEASQIVSEQTNAATPKQKQTLPPPVPAPSPVAEPKGTEGRRVCFRSLKGGPNKTTEVVIPQERIVHGQNSIPQPATDSDMEEWLCWKKAMNSFTDDFRTGVLSSKSIMAVRFQESEDDSFVVLGFVAETKGSFYFVPVSNSTAEALMEDPSRFCQSAQAARAIQNNQAVYDRAKKKPFPDRTKLAKKMLDAIKAEESVWRAVPQPKAPRKPSASRSKASKDDSAGAAAAAAAAGTNAGAVRTKEASASPKTRAVLSDEEDADVTAASSKKAKAGGSRRVQSLALEEPKAKAMKQSTLLQPSKAKESRAADTPPPPQGQHRALEDDAALLPEPSEAHEAGLTSSAKRTKTDSASSDATCAPEEQQHRHSHRKRAKATPAAQDATFWSVDLPMLPPPDEQQTSVLCRAEWQQGQTGALQIVVTQHFSMPIPRGRELASAGVFLKTTAEKEAEPLKIALRPAQA